jgi:Putative peptidoglycan binding domain/L,D-transpeptidase catalytic domain
MKWYDGRYGGGMKATGRRWLRALGAVTAVAGCVLGQGAAGTAPASSVSLGGQARAAAAAYLPPVGILRPGMHGGAVRNLQRRLAQLHYYPGPVNGYFGKPTVEAVWAFKEVQGLQTRVRPDDVGRAMQRALASPRQPRVLVPRGGRRRVEVNLAREVLVLYRHNKVELISHISAGGGYYYRCPGGGTCGPAITPDGNYRARWFASGWLRVPLGRMYNPVFFSGGSYAIHGDLPVPLRPASHGCVRIPLGIARFFHKLIYISQPGGTPIYIRGRAPGT